MILSHRHYLFRVSSGFHTNIRHSASNIFILAAWYSICSDENCYIEIHTLIYGRPLMVLWPSGYNQSTTYTRLNLHEQHNKLCMLAIWYFVLLKIYALYVLADTTETSNGFNTQWQFCRQQTEQYRSVSIPLLPAAYQTETIAPRCGEYWTYFPSS